MPFAFSSAPSFRKSIPGAAVLAALALALAAAPRGASAATIIPSGFVEAKVATGFDRPTQMAVTPDGRVFILQQGGAIRVFKNGALLSTPFASLGNIFSTQDYGLLGLAFDPDFAANGHLFLFAAMNGSPAYTRILRVTANGDLMVPGSESQIFQLDNFTGTTHQGGALHFGNDGKLYIFTGTPNGNTNDAQVLTRTYGKVLRINKDGSIPADNPHFAATTGIYRSIYARGLRNPFTAAVQAATGRIFINDNGQDAWEEVNEAAPGANYGWPLTEGNTGTPPAGYKAPFHTYSHVGQAGNSGSIVAAAFYNPPTAQFPAAYIGKYFFADHVLGEIRYLDPASASPAATVFATGIDHPLDIKIGPDGSFYYLSRGNSSDPNTTGLYRIQYAANLGPVVNQNPSNQLVSVGETATFCASVSGTAPLALQWQKNGANVAGATSACHTTPATVLADNGAVFRITASNPWGTANSAGAVLSVTSNKRPTASITAPAAGAKYDAGTVLGYSGTGTDPDEGNLAASRFTWWINFHHNTHSHTALPATSGMVSGTLPISNNDEKNDDVFYRIHLRVADAQGLTDEDSVDVLPNKTILTVATTPPGLPILVDGASRSTPYTWTSVVGIEWNLSAPILASSGSNAYRFAAWSDGLPADHKVYAPAANAAYTATYAVDNTRGTLLRQVWNGITGPAVASLTSNANFPNNPSAASALTAFEGPTNVGDNYGSRISGLLYPPATGAYTFWIAGDDNVELWLSTTPFAANKVKIAFHNDWTTPRQWNKVASQQSAPITLTAGRKYYIEALHKENTGGDNLAVAWQGPGISQQVIPGAQLSYPEAPGPLPAPWETADIGAPGMAGSAGYSDGYFSVSGGGTDIWGTADAFRFVYQTLNGDGEIRARVESVQNTDPYAKAGVMMRDGLGANAANIMAALAFTQGAAVQHRATAGGTTVNTVSGNLAPYWVRLVRAGNVFTAYRSADGSAWTQSGQATIAMGASIRIGVAVTAHNNALLNTSVVSNVAVSSAAQAPSITQQPASQSVNLGQTATFSVAATGSPAPTYQWRKNGTDIAGATSPSYTTPATVGGDNGAVFSVRVANALGSVTSGNATLTVVAQAPAITSQPASVSVQAGQTAAFTVGASGIPAPAYQWFRNGAAIPGATSATYTTPATVIGDNGAVFTATAANSQGSATSQGATLTVTTGGLPAPWSNADIGGPAIAGSATLSAGTFTVKGGGADIWGTADAFHFVHQTLTGDGEIRARVDAVQNTDPYAKAGVMMRDGLSAGAVNVMASVAYTQGSALQYRTAAGGTTVNAVSGSLAPYWVRLVRAGNSFTAYRSSNGMSWTRMGQATLAVGATLRVGLAVTAHNNAMLNTSAFSNVSVTGAPAYTETDIGAVGFAGSHTSANGTHTVKGSGADVVGTVDAFHYSHVPLNGDGEIQVRVTAIQNTNAWAKAGIMIRDGLAANARHATLFLSYANGTLFERRLAAGGGTSETITGGFAAPYWLRLGRAGNVFSAYRSADGVNWTLIGQETIAMPASVRAGLAVTAVNNAALATDTFDNVLLP